eukprot:1158835-Pelagomonas_calceolata.AAC.16
MHISCSSLHASSIHNYPRHARHAATEYQPTCSTCEPVEPHLHVHTHTHINTHTHTPAVLHLVQQHICALRARLQLRHACSCCSLILQGGLQTQCACAQLPIAGRQLCPEPPPGLALHGQCGLAALAPHTRDTRPVDSRTKRKGGQRMLVWISMVVGALGKGKEHDQGAQAQGHWCNEEEHGQGGDRCTACAPQPAAARPPLLGAAAAAGVDAALAWQPVPAPAAVAPKPAGIVEHVKRPRARAPAAAARHAAAGRSDALLAAAAPAVHHAHRLHPVVAAGCLRLLHEFRV